MKWKERDTDEVIEASIDLSKRLPTDLDDKSIHFLIGQGAVHVYVATLKGVITTECPTRNKERAADPTNPDLIARSYFCGKQLQKVYPEAKQLS